MISESADLFESRGGGRPGALEDDLVALLESRVRALVERLRSTQRAVAELREALAARDRRIVELDAKLGASERARGELVARIDALIADVDRLMQAAEDGAGRAAEG